MVGVRSIGGSPRERRRAAIAACRALLAERGVGGVSARSVSARAGLSPASLRQLFATNTDLIAAVYSDMGDQVSAARAAAVVQAGQDARARLSAYLAAGFSPPISDPDLFSTWLAFWQLSRTDPRMARMHAEIYVCARAEIETLLGACDVPKARRRRAATAIFALVDGLWFERALDPSAFTAQEAIAITERLLDVVLED